MYFQNLLLTLLENTYININKIDSCKLNNKIIVLCLGCNTCNKNNIIQCMCNNIIFKQSEQKCL